MAGISTSVLANLLVSVASHEHDDQSRRGGLRSGMLQKRNRITSSDPTTRRLIQ